MQESAHFMGTEVFPLDPESAKRERFISLHQLIHWLDKAPYPKGTFPPPDWALLWLAERHIRAGRLRTYGPSVRITPKMVSAPGEIIEDGEVHQAEIFDMRFDTQEQPKNPLLDIFEFSEWFLEVKPDYCKLPDNWPVPEVDQVSISAPQAIPPASLEPAEEWRFHYVRAGSSYTGLCEELSKTLHKELGKNATGAEAWARLMADPPQSFGASIRTITGRAHLVMSGERPLSKKDFMERWKSWTGK